ncbi:MAG: hypothetical protein WA634_12755 [Silvibacterium sp.]
MKTKTQSGIALATTLIVMFLVVALVIGFSWMVLMDQRLGGVNGAEQYTFYGAEAGLEKLTGDLATLFANNSSPSGAQVNAIAVVANAPIIQGIQYLNPNGSLGYQIAFPQDGSGNPLATNHLIQSGNYQGMTGLLTPYTLTVTSTNPVSRSEVRLTRNVQTVAIPVFQFGMFSQTDLSFFAGPDFDFGGNVMTNGNLFLASGADLVFNGKVLSAKDIIRQTLSNGYSTTSAYAGSVYIPTTSGGCPTTSYPSGNTAGCVALLPTQGSLVGGLGSAQNSAFPNLAKSTYNSYVGSSETNVKPVNLSITLNAGANPIDLVRRSYAGEDSSNPDVLAQRYYSQASLRILLSDNPADITNLPCVSATAPTNLETLTTANLGGVPIAESYSSGTYTPAPGNGYWPKTTNTPLVTGYIKIEIQTSYAVSPAPCGTWKDVTAEVLGFGIAGKNINPSKTYTTYGYTYLPPLPTTQQPYQGTGSTCTDPSTNAIIRLERVRDNPSTGGSSATKECGFSSTGVPSTTATDYWPNVLFDAREGNSRDITPTATVKYGATTYSYANMPTPTGVMDYTELDITDLAKYFMGTIGTDGTTAKDPVNSTNDFVVYFSDRRSNYTSSAVAGWPPASPSGNETGEYGFEDSINPSSAWGCPNGTLDTPETLDMVENPGNQVVGGTPEDYGEQSPMWATPTSTTPAPVNAYFPTLLSTLLTATPPAITKNPNCTAPTMPWPGAYIVQPQEARENIPIFFRRALKLVNGSSINLGTCPDGEPCGLTIVSENPVYVQGDFNAPAGSNGSATAAHVATSIVADAITLLSDSWNDVNSFSSLYTTSLRGATTTTYRFGAVAGKGISFPQPSTCGTEACYQDFGTDGGVHNFLRFLEDWSGTLYYRGSVVSFYYNRQAIGVYKDGLDNTVYNPPTRGYQFDSDFLTPSLLPPRTPMFRDVNTVGFTQVVLPTP